RAAEWRRIARGKTRRALLTTYVLLAVAVFGYNAWLLARGGNLWAHAARLGRSIARETGQRVGNNFLTPAVAIAALIVAAMLVRRVRRAGERVVMDSDWLKDRNRSLPVLFVRLERAIVRTGWLLVAVLACRSSVVLRGISDAVLLIARVYALL